MYYFHQAVSNSFDWFSRLSLDMKFRYKCLKCDFPLMFIEVEKEKVVTLKSVVIHAAFSDVFQNCR